MVAEAAFEEPWRVCCPEGHVGIRLNKSRKSAYCKLCGASYPREELTDLKEAETDSRKTSTEPF